MKAPTHAALLGLGLFFVGCKAASDEKIDDLTTVATTSTSTTVGVRQDDTFVRGAHESRAKQLLLEGRNWLAQNRVLARTEVLAPTTAPLDPAQAGEVATNERFQRDLATVALDKVDNRAAVLLRTLRFASAQASQRAQSPAFENIDPSWTVRFADAMLWQLEWRLVADELTAARCDASAQAITHFVDKTNESIGTFDSSQRDAIREMAELQTRTARLLGAISKDESAASFACRSSIATIDEQLKKWSKILVDRFNPEHLKSIETLATVEQIPRNRLGTKYFRFEELLIPEFALRFLREEEGVNSTLPAIREQLMKGWRRLDAMKSAATQQVGSAAKSSKWHGSQCLTSWTELVAVAKTLSLPVPAEKNLKCDRFEQLFPEAIKDPTLLRMRLIDVGMTAPDVNGFRASQDPVISLTRGHVLAHLHFVMRRIMYLSAARESEDLLAAVAEAQAWLCASMRLQPLWKDQHAEMMAIEDTCNRIGQPKLRLPDTTLFGLSGYGLALIPDEPHRMVGLDRFPWGPAGLLDRWMNPGESAQMPTQENGAGDVEVKVEYFGRTDEQGASTPATP